MKVYVLQESNTRTLTPRVIGVVTNQKVADKFIETELASTGHVPMYVTIELDDPGLLNRLAHQGEKEKAKDPQTIEA